MGLTSTRRFTLQCTHRLPDLGEGLHGHHFYVEVTVRGADHILLDQVFTSSVYSRLHGRDLSETLEKPTGEYLVQWIHETLLRSPLGATVLGVSVEETKKNRFTSSMTALRYV